MGKRSRKRVRAGMETPSERRPTKAEKRSTDSRRTGQAGRSASGSGAAVGFDQLRLIEDTLLAALDQFDRGDRTRADHHLEALARWWVDGTGRLAGVTPGVVPSLVCSYLNGEIDSAWQRGWQPADLHRVVGRELGPPHVDVTTQAIGEQAESYRAHRPTLKLWMDQLDQIDAAVRWGPADDHLVRLGIGHQLDHRGVLRVALEVLALIHKLPDIPRLWPPPSEWGRSAAVAALLDPSCAGGDADVRYLEKIRGLLAKAESTEFDEEAASLTAKAHELMTRHAIDAALVEAHATGRKSGEQPTAVRIGIDDPYAQPKVMLLGVIGKATRCRTVWSKELGFATVFGFAGDLRAVELMFTSLLLQARSAMMRAGTMGRWARSRSFRQSFLVGFASRIGTRLTEAAHVALAGAEDEVGSAFLPVLAERIQLVDDLRDESFGTLEQIRLSANNQSGWAVGTQAADEAHLSSGLHLEEQATG